MVSVVRNWMTFFTLLVLRRMLKRACESLRPLIGCLYELTECVATIDVIISLTHACSLGEYRMFSSSIKHSKSDLNKFSVRPIFHGVLVLEQSRHPILDRSLAEQPVPNNAVSLPDVNVFQ